MPTDTHEDTITIAIKKATNQLGTWSLIGGIRVRFGSARAAIVAYQQHMTQHHNKNRHAERLLTYNG